MKIKRKAYLIIRKIPLIKKMTGAFIKVNDILFHWNERKTELHNGLEDPQRTYFVIRSRGRQEGLISTYYYVLESMNYAYGMGYVPIVDFNSDLCQYHVKYSVNATSNAWEYYFKQPMPLDTFDQNSKRNVILSGWSLVPKKTKQTIGDEWKRKFFDEICPVQPYIMNIAHKKYQELFNTSQGGVLGVFLRGTDYVSLKPKGHPIQPTVEMVEDKIDLFVERHDISRIYVVTEDYSIYSAIQDRYGDIVFSADDNFVKDYDKNDFLESSLKRDAYTRGLDYLIRLILLTKCDYLITSLASGSQFVMDLKKDKYKDEFVFNLGVYE